MQIKDTKELLQLIAALAVTAKTSKSDGKVSVSDLTLLISLIPKISPALEGIENIPSEIKDLSESELNEIKAIILETVGEVSDDRATEIASNLLEASVKIFNVVSLLTAKGSD